MSESLHSLSTPAMMPDGTEFLTWYSRLSSPEPIMSTRGIRG